MNPAGLLALQFSWFLVAWSALTTLLVAPAIRSLPRDDRLAVWVAPQVFRVLGVGLLVPGLSPGLPTSFALPTAIGDGATAVLALVALVALRTRRPGARAWAWAASLFGSADMALALVHAVRVGAASYLEGQWFVPAVGAPLMIVAHYRAFRVLLERKRP